LFENNLNLFLHKVIAFNIIFKIIELTIETITLVDRDYGHF